MLYIFSLLLSSTSSSTHLLFFVSTFVYIYLHIYMNLFLSFPFLQRLSCLPSLPPSLPPPLPPSFLPSLLIPPPPPPPPPFPPSHLFCALFYAPRSGFTSGCIFLMCAIRDAALTPTFRPQCRHSLAAGFPCAIRRASSCTVTRPWVAISYLRGLGLGFGG